MLSDSMVSENFSVGTLIERAICLICSIENSVIPCCVAVFSKAFSNFFLAEPFDQGLYNTGWFKKQFSPCWLGPS